MSLGSVNRLKNILAHKYSLGLELTFMEDTSIWSLETLSQLPAGMLMGTTLRIPIVVHGQYLGTIVLEGGHLLSANDQTTVTHLVKLALEPELYRSYLALQKGNTESSINETVTVISDMNEDFAEADLGDGPIFSHSDDSSEDSTKIARFFVIENSNSQLSHRLALSLHEQMKNFAFLSLPDVERSINSIDDLCELKDVTLFVPDWYLVSETMKTIILNYVSMGFRTGPDLLIATSSRLEDLQETQLLSDTEFSLFNSSRVDASRLPIEKTYLNATLEMLVQKNDLNLERLS